MADSKVKLTLQTVYDGKGMQQFNSAVANMSRSIKTATDGVKGISGELGALGGTAGKVADGVGKIFSSFSAGGVGVAVAVIGLIVSWLTSWKEKAEEAAKKQRDLFVETEKLNSESIDRARRAQIDFLDAMISKGNKAIDTLKGLVGHLNNLNNIQDVKNQNKAKQKNIQIDNELENRLAENRPEDNPNILRAVADLKKVMNTVNANQESARLKVGNAANLNALAVEDVARTEKAIEHENSKLQKLKQSLKDEKDRLSGIEFRNNSNKEHMAGDIVIGPTEEPIDTTPYKERISKIEAEIKRQEEVVEKAKSVNTTAKQKATETKSALELAKQQQQTVEQQSKSELNKANNAVLKAQEEEKTKALSDFKTGFMKTLDAMEKIAVDAGKNALQKQKEDVKEGVKAQNQNALDKQKAFRQTMIRGMQADMAHGGWTPYEYQLDENGMPVTVRGKQRAERFAERAEREAKNKRSSDENRFNKLTERLIKGKKLSKKDQEFYDSFQSMQDVNNTEKQIAENNKKAAETLVKIEQHLKDLGAK